MSSKGVKRASPGAESEKNPLGDVELTDDDALKLQAIQKDIARVELALGTCPPPPPCRPPVSLSIPPSRITVLIRAALTERRAQEKMVPVYEARRAILKGISKFWPVALMNHGLLALHAQHSSDQAALSYLEDLWLVRDPKESRCFTLEFVSILRFCPAWGQATHRILSFWVRLWVER